jgi:hypothetical protein
MAMHQLSACDHVITLLPRSRREASSLLQTNVDFLTIDNFDGVLDALDKRTSISIVIGSHLLLYWPMFLALSSAFEWQILTDLFPLHKFKVNHCQCHGRIVQRDPVVLGS